MSAVIREWRLLPCVVLLALACIVPSTARAQTEDLPALMQRIGELTREGHFKDAIPLGQQLVAGAERMAGKDHPMAALALFTLAELYRMQGELAEAEPMLQRVLAMREKTLAPDHPDVATTLASLSFLAVSQAKYRLAEQYAERALAIRTRALGAEHPDTGMVIVTLGRIRQQESRLEDAEQLFQRALALFEKAHGPEHINVAVALNNLAQVYQEQGRLTLAEPPLRRALAIQEKQFGPDSIFIAAMLNNLGELNRAMGRHVEAEALFRRELQISEKALGPDHPEVATSLGNLATLFTSMSRTSEAEGLLRRALMINEKAFGPQHPRVAVVLNNLANALSSMNRAPEAEALFRRSLAIRERQFGDNSPTVALALDNLGALMQQGRRYAEAEPLARRSLDIRKKAFGPEHLITSYSLNNLASLLDNLKRHGEAGPMLQRAVTIRRAALGDSHPLVAVTLHNLASHHLDVQEWQAALAAFRRATSIWIGRRASGRAGGSAGQDERAEIREHADPFLGLVIAAHHIGKDAGGAIDDGLRAEAFETAQWVTELGAAAAISGMSTRVAAGGGRLGQLVRTRQDLAEEAASVDRALIAAVSVPAQARKSATELALRQQAAGIAARLQELDGTLGASFPQYTSLTSAAPLPLTEAAKLLDPTEALLLFLPTRDGTFVWAVTRSQSRWLRVPLNSEALAERVAALRCGLDFQVEWSGPGAGKCIDLLRPASLPDDAASLPFDLARAHELYAALLGPVEDLISGKHLLIVPSGPLASLPFHVLVAEAPPTAVPADPGGYQHAAWLAKRAPITVLPSVASLKALRQLAKQSRATDPFVGFGNPLLTGHDGTDRAAWAKQSCPRASVPALKAERRGRPPARMPRGGLANADELRRQPPLPETADELCAVARLLGAPADAVHLGQGASERSLKALSATGVLERARIVHFATHGLLATEAEALAGARSEPALVLTPPNEASEEDDGLLTASEVAQLKLDADWVVLSACNTAAGAADLAGAEALSGLARAFFYAGARALLVSHWAVDSEATVELITRAFDEIKRDRTVGRAEALRRSMLALIGRGGRNAHPAVWAPFIVVGEGAT